MKNVSVDPQAKPIVFSLQKGGRAFRWKPLLALLLLVPAPVLGTFFGFYSSEAKGTETGQIIYAVAKIWLLILPLVWFLVVDSGKLSLSPVRRGGLKAGVVSGGVLSGFIFAGWLLAGRHFIDYEMIRGAAAAAGLGEPRAYLLFALYLCTINAVLEEYVWRWFVYRKAEDLIGRRGVGAVALSAGLFTLHHVLALLAQLPWALAIFASAGVFAGGFVWSMLYLRYRSIWPGAISHVIVDVTILLIGAHILFGGAS